MPIRQGDVAVVTGAGSGIGRELALQLAATYGCRLALCDVNMDGLQETKKLTGLADKDCLVARVDVSQSENLTGFRDAVTEHFGGRVNHVFNNAGVALVGNLQGPDAVSRKDFEWLMGINFWGVVNGSEAFLPLLMEQPGSSLVNISSVFGMMGIPGNGSYCASKFAVRGYTESLRNELALEGKNNLNVVCVHPGGIKTQIVRNARRSAGVAQMSPGQAKAIGLDPAAASGPATPEDEEANMARLESFFITPASVAARTILRGAHRGSKRVLIGPDARAIDWMVRLAPANYFNLVLAGVELKQRPVLVGVVLLAILLLVLAFLFA